jgi:urease accessory protein
MVLNKILGTVNDFAGNNLEVDRLHLQWFEAGKKILHKQTAAGKSVVLKLLNEITALRQDDVVFADNSTLIVIEIMPCEVMIIRPQSLYEMASTCYEIGNKHLPLYFEADALLMPFEKPLFLMLTASGFHPEKAIRKLLYPLKTTVSPHGNNQGSSSLFAKIMQLTANNTNG